tara:strand:- start:1145 stop:1414 length:270 start_codon:yes stop_codon:yes gene_type:complete
MSSQERLRRDVLKKLKGLSETVTDSIGDIAKGKNVFCDASITNLRLSTCNACPEFIRATSQCKKCGCFMSAKTRLKKASCPIGKWAKVQ